MEYERPLLTGKLIKRYKRFLSDIELITPIERAGEIVTAHCANTGSMTNCKDDGAAVWLFDSQNPKRKLPLSWEWVEVEGQYKACINTARANQLVKEALLANQIKEVEVLSAEFLKAEPKVDEGRLDFLVSTETDDSLTYIEVKSVTLLGNQHPKKEYDKENNNDGIGYFPDAVTSRGLKHLEVLMRLKAEGQRSILFFCVPHEGIKQVQVAEHIDPVYAKKLREVMAAGVEVLAYQVEFQAQGMVLKTPLTVCI
ncbi:MAG: DNA/RNA nuclease SfsA [Oleispira antarctica]|uniref:Sugar fermentation stimulation protein homolog n=1 Tax=Oleispira antarctica RB-8 TaxID=698738 RepID=R4YU92_OLEAN|nr:DNA/RNA nuclease SfsA [Oleispira antarctica]MBQ0792146.1 DNA/RNA nuclease SfsA [Oleispira antarctica]CCK77693.1 Sugar fermentation stimulation protein [Oleispira antarctica RB-8]